VRVGFLSFLLAWLAPSSARVASLDTTCAGGRCQRGRSDGA